jgi:hypothetical protein
MLSDRTPVPSRALPALTLGFALLLGACTAPGGASPTPSAAPPSAAPSAAPPSIPVASPSAAPSPSPSGPLSIGVAPRGPWSRLTWIDAGKAIPLGPTNVIVKGWSGGYVALEQLGGYDENGKELPVVIRASASSDGLHWSAPTTLDTAGLVANIAIDRIVEGPAGLLALGYPYGDTCGGPAVLAALWSSTDGAAWERLALPKAFTGNEVLTISGGSAGFIATGNRGEGTTPGLWTSADGRSWIARPLPKVASGTLALDGAVSFAGGFAVAGSVLGEEGCGGAEHIRAATWWSADGAAWTRAALPGSLTEASARLWMRALNDATLMILQESGDGEKRLAWTSGDGRTWTAVEAPSQLADLRATGDGRHTAMLVEPESGSGAPAALEIAADGRVTTLDQRGPGPTFSEDGPGWEFTVGPTGIVAVTSDGSSVRLGVASCSMPGSSRIRRTRRSAASAAGIWRKAGGRIGRHARQPATSQPETARSSGPQRSP